MQPSELTISSAQYNQPWTVPYSVGFERCISEIPHLYASHTVLHAMKSIGKIAAVLEELDHSGNQFLTPDQKETIKNMSADMITSALRLANLFSFDIAGVFARRVSEKNGVNILEKY